MSDPIILITGGTGFAGSHLVEELLAQEFGQIFVTTYGDDHTYVHDLLPNDHILKLDLSDREATFELLKKVQPTWIFHLASIAIAGNSFEKAASIFQNNIALQLNLLEAVKMHTPEARVLVVGSGMEYGMVDVNKYPTISEEVLLQPTNPYGVSKVTQDLLGLSYVYSYQLDVVRVRPFNHIGERQTTDFAIPSFANQIAQIEQQSLDKILVGNLDAVRDFSDAKDVVKGYILLLQKGLTGEVYNIGGGKGYTMKSVLEKMCSMATVPVVVETEAARLRPVDVPVAVANIQKIKALGWEPTIPLEQTLERVLNEWRERVKN